MRPTRHDAVSALARSFAIQGSWNFRTLVAGGLAVAMLPLLRRIYAGDPVGLREALERHLAPFNGHPYLCSIAVGALSRLEHEGAEAVDIVRFRDALTSPLGAIGDRLVWTWWRPFCALLAIIGFSLGLGAWGSVSLFLLVYNAGHLFLRVRGLHMGWSAGRDVASALRSVSWARLPGAMLAVNAALAGAAVVLVDGAVLAAADRQATEPAVGATLVATALAAGVVGYLRPGLGELVATVAVLLAPFALAVVL